MMSEDFFDWTQLPYPTAVYERRRHQLQQQLLQSGGGVFLAPSQVGFSAGFTFRQLNDFLYFTGLELPDSLLILDADTDETILFVPKVDSRFYNSTRPNDFPGRPLATNPDLPHLSGVTEIRLMDEAEKFINHLATNGRLLRLNPERPGEITSQQPTLLGQTSIIDNLILYLQQITPSLTLKSAYTDVAKLRMVKSPEEISTIRQACEIGMIGIRETAKSIRPGVDERALEGILESIFKQNGAQRLPFASIIKSGPNALWPWRILAAHYDRRNRQIQAGELVLFDVGCELNYYGSDIGRTFPVNGRFTPVQRDILEMQLAVLEGMITAVRPGITLAELQQAGEKLIPPEAKPYMQVGHFFGHHIGLSPGDPNLPDAPLAPGMVITIEPWYYNHDTGIATFLEDDILVTTDGYENLTADLPKTPSGLESLLN